MCKHTHMNARTQRYTQHTHTQTRRQGHSFPTVINTLTKPLGAGRLIGLTLSGQSITEGSQDRTKAGMKPTPSSNGSLTGLDSASFLIRSRSRDSTSHSRLDPLTSIRNQDVAPTGTPTSQSDLSNFQLRFTWSR